MEAIRTLSPEAVSRLYAVIPLLLANVTSSQMKTWCGQGGSCLRPEEPNLCNTELCVGEARTYIMAGAIRRFASNPLSFRLDSRWYNDDGTPHVGRRDW